MAGILRAGHSALGQGHRSCPPMDYGCHFLWEPRWGKDIGQERGAPQTAARGIAYTYTGAFNYPFYDPGKGRYIEVGSATDTVPYDGHFLDYRQCKFTTCDPPNGVRGPFTAQPGLTLDTITRPSNHIVRHFNGEALNMARVRNTSGATKRMYIQETTDVAQGTYFSLLVKRSDGGVVDENTCEINSTLVLFGDPYGVDENIVVPATHYQKVRDDGWYFVWGWCPAQGSGSDAWYHVKWKDGIECYYEAPSLQILGAADYKVPLLLMNDSGTTTSRNEFLLNFNESLDMDIPQAGWLGMSFVPHADVTGTYLVPLETGYCIRLVDDTGVPADWHQLYYSNSTQSLAYQCVTGGATQSFLQIPAAELLQGSPIGMVATWGYRGGTPQFVMAANGVIKEVDTTGTLPASSVAGTKMHVGSDGALGNPANGSIYKAAMGTKMLSRAECANLSRWFQKQAADQNYIGLTGT